MSPGRRVVLQGLAAGLILGPGWLRDAFAADGASHPSPLLAAYRRAQRAGVPLLVFVVPDDSAFQTGTAFGALLNHGGEVALSTLAMVELVCAGAEDLHTLVPGAAIPSDAWMVLLETDRVPVTPVLVAGTPPAAPFDPATPFAQEDAQLDRTVIWLRDQLRGLVVPDLATLARRDAQAEAADPVGVAKVRSALAHHDLTLEEASWAPATVARAAATASPAGAAAAVSLLAEVGHARWVTEPVPGSRWAQSTGCGLTFETPEEAEGDNVRMMACGMGFVPVKGRRMLSFWTQP